jgi:hypothetical protein
VRLPLRHPPPRADAPLRRCRHLELLAEAARGVPLGPAAEHLISRGRGRHGNALQWHFGLDAHDSSPEPDWEARIEIKLISVWQRADGRLGCDRVKVCDVAMDPWRKLGNVLFVFADRLTRVVLGHCFHRLAGESRERLARSWVVDPHFGQPELMLESREDSRAGTMAPAYYLAARWLEREGLLPNQPVGIGYRFDASWWGASRAEHRGRDPLITLARVDHGELTDCPRCRGRLRCDLARVFELGWAPAIHQMPLGDDCALRGHVVVDPRRLPASPVASDAEQFAGVESRVPNEKLWRLADRVPEPDDHEH